MMTRSPVAFRLVGFIRVTPLNGFGGYFDSIKPKGSLTRAEKAKKATDVTFLRANGYIDLLLSSNQRYSLKRHRFQHRSFAQRLGA